MRDDYTESNSGIWDKWAENGCEWTIPVTHEEYVDAKNGKWGVYLTPSKLVPKRWFLPFSGTKLLGLASGGGQQMPIFCALGAECKLLDYSDRQLESERVVSQREGYCIDIVKGDMSKKFPFDDESFNTVFHPVSNCYVEDVYHVWNECFRVLKKGGVLLAGMDNGLNFLFEDFSPLTLLINYLTIPAEMQARIIIKG